MPALLRSSLVLLLALAGCTHARSGELPKDGGFGALAERVLRATFRRQPTQATFLGVHDHDAELEDWSRESVQAEVDELHEFRARIAVLDLSSADLDSRLDREWLLHAIDSRVLTLDVVRPWANNPDLYASGAAYSAYVLVKREFAPAATRLRALVARERAMPGLFRQARENLVNPPRILAEIALEQIAGNREFFASAVPAAFAGVRDDALVAEFAEANSAVLAAFDDYARWLRDDLLPRSTGEFALGAETYRRKLWFDEMVDLPLDELLVIAERDLRKNQADFEETARRIDATRPPAEVLAELQGDHPGAADLLATTQRELDSLARFITERRIVTIPQAAPARVQETPPFLRATTSASMDTPGPFESVATEAYYSMTLPDPAWSPAQIEEFMKQWYYAAITNVSVHEVWPGHYLQFLNARHFPSAVRKVFGANTNSEGWAHYCEQMMIDEGLNAGSAKHRLAQLQDALLRDVRFIVGIRMHTAGMSVAEARELFVTEAWQPIPVAESEAKRATSDPTFGYYTMGKLMILKLREEWRKRMGPEYTLGGFHDAFLALGPLPLPLIRRAMLGTVGRPL